MPPTEIEAQGSWPGRVRSWREIEEATGVRHAAHDVDLIVFRHGQTIRNAEGEISGRADVPLTILGEEQAAEMGRHLKGLFDAAFHSDLDRSRRTLSLALEHSDCAVRETHTDIRLSERSMGELEGMPSRPIPAYDAGDLLWAPNGGEPYLNVTQRMMSFVLDLTDMATERAKRVLVSTHVGPMRMMVGALTAIANPAEAMTTYYANANPWHGTLRLPEWPRFVSKDLTHR